MTFKRYQKQAVSFRTESSNNEEYLALGLIAEVGEAAGKLAKRIRDGVFDEKAFIKELGDILWFVANFAEFCDDDDIDIALEDSFVKGGLAFGSMMSANDILREITVFAAAATNGEADAWNFQRIVNWIAGIAAKCGYTLEEVAEINIAKLRDRQARGAIKGDGDER